MSAGYEANGYDNDGYDGDGYDIDGYDVDGYDANGYDNDGYDGDGYDACGYDIDGYDGDGYDANGNNIDGCGANGYNGEYQGKIIISIKGKDTILNKDDYSLFNKPKGRGNNDKNNKQREIIIYALVNDIIPQGWYETNEWQELKEELFAYIGKYCYSEYDSIKCIFKGGRSFNYDFDFEFTVSGKKVVKHIEFKYGCSKVTGCPQFLSLSSNFNTNYSEYFYDTCIQDISTLYEVDKPEKGEYLKNVTQTNYSKLDWFNTIYTNEKGKIKEKKKIVDKSINDYLVDNARRMNIEELNAKFYKTQNGKQYMCFKDGLFHVDAIDNEEIVATGIKELKSGRNKLKNTVVLKTNTNSTIHMLLRWRNHAGVLNPAWQIKMVR